MLFLATAALALGTALFVRSQGDRWRRQARDLDRLISAERIGTTVQELAHQPHRAGQPANRQVGDAILRRLAGAGLKTSATEYGVDLPEPVENHLFLTAPERRELPLFERALAEDPPSAAAPTEPLFFAFAPDGDVEAPVVYANFGATEDYDLLKKSGVKVEGAIALVRSQGICRSMKGLVAEREGVKGLLLYPELRDQGVAKPPFPKGPNINQWTGQRGTLLRYFLQPGEPQPGEEAVLPTVPAVPVTPEIAATLLARIEGAAAPEAWTGWMKVPYRLGLGPARVRLTTVSRSRRRQIRNVFGALEGTDPSLPPLIVGAHYDAWVYGAVDPCSGAATVLETATALAELRRRSWKPARGVLFAFWDAEEYGFFGSTRWVEERLSDLHGSAAAFINVDSAVRASDFVGFVEPGLRGALDDALKLVEEPHGSGQSLYDVRGAFLLPGFSSDTAPFLGFRRIPVAEIGFGRSYPVYHSLYDDMTWVREFGDRGFGLSRALAKVLALYVAKLVDGPVLPVRFREIADFIRESLRDQKADTSRGPFRALADELARYESVAAAWDEVAGARPLSAAASFPINRELVRALEAFAVEPASFGQGDLLVAPSEASGCAAQALPTLARSRGAASPKLEAAIDGLIHALAGAREHLVEATRLAKAR